MNIIRRLVICCGLILCLFGLNVSITPSQHTENLKPSVARNVVETNKSQAEIENPSKSKETITKTLSSGNSNALHRVGVQTGQTLPLSLDDAIRKALENNNDIEIAKNDVKIAESTLRSLLGIYDPVFTITPNYTNSVQPQPSTLGGADLSGVTRSSEFRLDGGYVQPIRRGGGNFNAFFNNNRNSTNSTFSQLNPTFNTNLGLSFTQPILRNRSIDNNRRQIRIQQKRVAQSDADFRRQTITIISQVQQGYWDLVFALRDQQNRMANLNLAKENLRQIEARIEAGAAAPLARAEVETELANRESDLLLATQQVSQAENRLKQLVLREPDAPEWSTQFVPTDKPVFSDEVVNFDDVMKDAIENRPELRRLKLQGEINTID
ncbi:MAG: TolC family protein, partial [Acidobacteriota bacterium]|nr:TolC family protein [Acidobacteriota bacterium]